MADTLAQALLAFQALGAKFQKDSLNGHFKTKYLSTDALLTDLIPHVNECGLVVLQMPTHLDGLPALTTRIVHAATGEAIESTMLLLESKRDAQGQGAALTYARRYALMAFLGLSADEDTDGNTPAARRSRSAQGNAEPKAGGSGGSTPSAAPPANGTKVISEKQLNRLFAIAGSRVPEDEQKRIVLELAGVNTRKDIPVSKYDAVCAAIESWVPFE